MMEEQDATDQEQEQEENTTTQTTPEPMVCMNCGTEKSCGCSAPYGRRTDYAMAVIKRNPGKSDRAHAEETGISARTFKRARDRLLEDEKNKPGSARAASKIPNGISIFRQQLKTAAHNVAPNNGIGISGHINTKPFQMVLQPPPPWPEARDKFKQQVKLFVRDHLQGFHRSYGPKEVKEFREWMRQQRW